MTKHKKNQTKPISLPLVVSIVSLAAVFLLTFVVLTEKSRVNVLYDQQAQAHLDDSYNASRITFCYNENIHPCTDEAISAWNKTHPEDQFTTVRPRL